MTKENTLEIYVTNPEQSVMEAVAAELDAKLERHVSDSDMHELIFSVAEVREIELKEPIEDEEPFMKAAQLVLDFRNGKGRNEIKATELTPRARAALDKVVKKEKMKENTKPAVKKAYFGLLPGAAGKIPRIRQDYLVELIETGEAETDILALIGSERPIDMEPNAEGLTELDRARSAGFSKNGVQAKTEFDLLRNTATHKFDIKDEEWDLLEGQDGRVPGGEGFQQNWRIAYAKTPDGKHIFVTSAAMISEDRYRPDGKPRTQSNTTDGFMMVTEMLSKDDPDALRHALVVTDAISVPFQGADASAALAPFGFTVETVGYSRDHAGLPDWPRGSAYYLQEVLSTLRRTRAGRDYLARKVEQAKAA